jgi:hypothetical protein
LPGDESITASSQPPIILIRVSATSLLTFEGNIWTLVLLKPHFPASLLSHVTTGPQAARLETAGAQTYLDEMRSAAAAKAAAGERSSK